MIDLHCHILPEADDGPADLQEALAMARIFAADGLTHVVATPHCHRFTHLLKADVLPRVAQFNRDLAMADISLQVMPGSEIQVTNTTEYRREFEAGLFCHLCNGTAFTLLEFNWVRDRFPPDAVELIEWIRHRGMTPILAHPERYEFFRSEPHLLKDLMDAGAWMQITVDSILGNHGPMPMAHSKILMSQFESVVLATDSHNTRRCSGLSAGFEWVSENFGIERGNDLRKRAEQVLASAPTIP